MDLNQFTTKAQQAVLDAQRLAESYNHSELEPAHLLLALLNQTDGVVPQVVSKRGVHIAHVIQPLDVFDLHLKTAHTRPSRPGSMP
jgi:ATP-dependent Clp protease ATP-binding subunit ClpB